jgi:hypothetical protein
MSERVHREKLQDPYRFRAARSLVYLQYFATPYCHRQGANSVVIPSLSLFGVAIGTSGKYFREDLKYLQHVNLIKHLTLGHNCATLYLKDFLSNE